MRDLLSQYSFYIYFVFVRDILLLLGKEQCCGSGFNGVPEYVSGSRRAKMTHKNRKKLIITFFEMLDVLF